MSSISRINNIDKTSSTCLESFVSTNESFSAFSPSMRITTPTMTSSSSAHHSLKTQARSPPLSPKRNLQLKLTSSSKSISPKRRKSTSSSVSSPSYDKENDDSSTILDEDEITFSSSSSSEYTRPKPPKRPMPKSPSLPVKNVVNGSVTTRKRISSVQATCSISDELCDPLYLTSARILNTPENSTDESFEIHEASVSNDKQDKKHFEKDDSETSRRRISSTHSEDEALRLSITRSTGGIGTSVPRTFFNQIGDDEIFTSPKTAAETTTAVRKKERKVVTSGVIDALRIQCSDRGTTACDICGSDHNPRHSRVCIMCFSPMCQKCKKINMVKLAKKSWVCSRCLNYVKIQFPIRNTLCTVCDASKCRRSRSCLLCKKHYCEVCKKSHMFKLGTAKWICHTHSMKDAFWALKKCVLDSPEPGA